MGRNRAINFKRLWIDAFLGHLAALLRPRRLFLHEHHLFRMFPRRFPESRPVEVAFNKELVVLDRSFLCMFKSLMSDFLGQGSFLKQLWAVTRLRAKRLARRKVAWDALGSALKESMVRGATAKSLVLSKFGRLPTKYAP